MEGEAEPIKIFDRHATLNGTTIVDLKTSPDEKWMVLIGIKSEARTPRRAQSPAASLPHQYAALLNPNVPHVFIQQCGSFGLILHAINPQSFSLTGTNLWAPFTSSTRPKRVTVASPASSSPHLGQAQPSAIHAAI